MVPHRKRHGGVLTFLGRTAYRKFSTKHWQTPVLVSYDNKRNAVFNNFFKTTYNTLIELIPIVAEFLSSLSSSPIEIRVGFVFFE